MSKIARATEHPIGPPPADPSRADEHAHPEEPPGDAPFDELPPLLPVAAPSLALPPSASGPIGEPASLPLPPSSAVTPPSSEAAPPPSTGVAPYWNAPMS